MRVIALLLCAVVGAAFAAAALNTAAAGHHHRYFPPHNDVPRCAAAGVANTTLYYDMLEASRQMPAQVVAVRVGVPFNTLAAFFDIPSAWPLWNHLFATNGVADYALCAHFDNVTYTNAPRVQPPFPSGMTAPHWIDQHGYNARGDVFAFGWIFQLNTAAGANLVYGRHTFTLRHYVDESGLNATVAESWEKAAGPQLDTHVNVDAWTVALQESRIDASNGFICLERVYTAHGALTVELVNATCNPFTP